MADGDRRFARDDDALSLRAAPVNHEAEIQLLGAILTNGRAYEKVGDFLKPEHFADDRHARIFEACGKLINRGQIANATTLKNYFEQDASLAEIGGVPYLAKMAGAAVTIINSGDHGRLIHDLYLRRQLIALGEDITNRAYAHDLETGAKEQIEQAESALFNLAEADTAESGPRAIGAAATTQLENINRANQVRGSVTGLPTGLVDLDKYLGGLHDTDLDILAGRPAMGKTALAVQIAYRAAADYREEEVGPGVFEVAAGAKVAFFSLEMSAEQLAGRIFAQQCGIAVERQRRGEVGTLDEMPALLEFTQRLRSMPLFIDDTPRLSVAAIRQRARRLLRSQGLGLVVIDYIQMIEPEHRSRGEQNRVQEMTAITRGLKGLAKELKVPILALSQLSRDLERRDDKRPLLADLRDSGSIEQDADTVIFLYRDEYYLERAEPKQRADEEPAKFDKRMSQWATSMEQARGIAEAIIPKNRHGPVRTVKLHFDGPRTMFGNLQLGSAP